MQEPLTSTLREVLLTLAQTFDAHGVDLLCEPSVIGAKAGAPDVVIVDPHSGVHVVEVKGVTIDQVRSIQPGGALEISYDSGTKTVDPVKQAQKAMYDVKDAARDRFGGETNIPFEAWVAFPRIRRWEWEQKFGEAVSSRREALFADDLESSTLGNRLRKEGMRRLAEAGLSSCPAQQVHSVMASFGDSGALAPPPRPQVKTSEGSRGERLSEVVSEYRALTEQQARLAAQGWNDGPRLVRGVAGSGKTIVLATQVARLIERLKKDSQPLFDPDRSTPPILVVCFNRALVPFLRSRICAAYRQRTGDDLNPASIMVCHFNKVMFHLQEKGLVTYRNIKLGQDAGAEARKYLAELESVSGDGAKQLRDGLFHSVFVDEGQDFHEDEYRVLLKLTSRTASDLPRFFVFYDDAQNLYGLQRPVWRDLGLEIKGRAVVMEECHRNTRQIVELAFNVLVGTYASNPQVVRTRSFADVAALEEKGLVVSEGGHYRVQFARREGPSADLYRCASARDEVSMVAGRVEKLISNVELLPQDVLVLAMSNDRAKEVFTAIASRVGENMVRSTADKDQLAIQTGRVTVSTIASAKGYDAPMVLIVSANEFGDSREDRAMFYVGCTRAREWLEVSAFDSSPLVLELERAIGSVRPAREM